MGNCEEVFACLFQVCAVLPHQACADGSVFFRRQLSKAGLSGSTHHLPLIPDPNQPVRANIVVYGFQNQSN